MVNLFWINIKEWEISLLEIPISSTNFTLWKVTFSVWKTYDRNKFSYDDAYENFESICDGVVPDQFEEDFEEEADRDPEAQRFPILLSRKTMRGHAKGGQQGEESRNSRLSPRNNP